MKNRVNFTGYLPGACRALFFLLALLVADSGSAATAINVSTDRNPVRLDESFTLTFSSLATPNGEPDFLPLEEAFDILNQSQSSNISVINGSYTRSVSWKLEVMARKAGALTLPVIAFGSDSSEPFRINVLPASGDGPGPDDDIVVEVQAEPRNPYVQAQILYTIQFLRKVDIVQASLSEPVMEDAVIVKLGDDRNFSVMRNGYRYAVTERKFAVFPQKSGSVVIPPVEMKVDVVTSGGRGFFDRRATRARRIRSKAVALDVRPVPPEFTGDYWLPAEQVFLEQQWSHQPLSVPIGEPLTRTMKMTVSGAPLSLLPDFGKSGVQGAGSSQVKRYPDQPVVSEQAGLSGIVSTREQKTALIPAIAGRYRLQGFELPWWNTRTDRLEVARVPEVEIEGLALAAEEAGRQANEFKLPAQDVPKQRLIGRGNRNHEAGGYWAWVSGFLALGWVATLGYLFLKRSRPEPDDAERKPRETAAERQLVRNVRKACLDNNPVQAKDMLLMWAHIRWGASPPVSLSALAGQCNEALGGEIRKLSRQLYSEHRGAWNGSGLLVAFKGFPSRGGSRLMGASKSVSGLEPLY
ncbi:MAG: BatD family protein [Pseudomonadota bacterium]|nr:BatD family protein [Pseudomonadota bacterium]